MTTLREVAAQAGVSATTAWRVAHGDAAVRPETRQRVERVMRDFLYVLLHREPATGVIGLLVPELSNPIFPALAQALEARATEAGFASILCNTRGAMFREIDYVHMLLDRRVDGMIFISCEMTNLRGDHSHYERLVEEGARLVFVNGSLPSLGIPAVGIDERTAGELATQHLIALGHTRIGFLAGPQHYLPTQLKMAGRTAALRGAGLSCDELVAHGAFGVDGGRAALAELLDEHDSPPTGVICSSDLMAIGALQEATTRGLDVPRDLSVVGFDGIDATNWTRPPLTTIDEPIAEIAETAETAVTALLQLIAEPDKALPDYYFRPTLRVRASTAPPPARVDSLASRA